MYSKLFILLFYKNIALITNLKNNAIELQISR